MTAGGTMKTVGGSQNSNTFFLGGGITKTRVPIMGGGHKIVFLDITKIDFK